MKLLVVPNRYPSKVNAPATRPAGHAWVWSEDRHGVESSPRSRIARKAWSTLATGTGSPSPREDQADRAGQAGLLPAQAKRRHEPSDFRDVLIDLQKRGVVFYCNRLDGGRYVLPEELVDRVKAALGIEMTRVGGRKLLEHLTKEQLATILESAGLPKSGNKAEQQERIGLAGLAPTESLDSLTHDDLYAVPSALPGAKVSGSKAERIERVIEYFDKMVFRDVMGSGALRWTAGVVRYPCGETRSPRRMRALRRTNGDAGRRASRRKWHA